MAWTCSFRSWLTRIDGDKTPQLLKVDNPKSKETPSLVEEEEEEDERRKGPNPAFKQRWKIKWRKGTAGEHQGEKGGENEKGKIRREWEKRRQRGWKPSIAFETLFKSGQLSKVKLPVSEKKKKKKHEWKITYAKKSLARSHMRNQTLRGFLM